MTLTDSKLGVIRKCVFEQCIKVKPELHATIVHHLARATGEMMERLSTLPLDTYGRLRFCLGRLARETGGFAVVQGLWTHQQLGELAGCCRETVTNILCDLKEGQWIQSEKQRITILRPLPESF